MKTKKIALTLVVVLGLMTLMFVPASPIAGDNMVSINVAQVQQQEGANFNVTVDIDSVTDFDAAQYDIAYDSAVIEVTGVTDGDISGTTIPVSAWDYIPTGVQGKIRIINNVEDYPGVTGSGYLAEVHFHVIGDVGDSSDITLSDGVLGDKDAQEIVATWTGGSVEIIATVTAGFSANITEALINQDIEFTGIATGGSGSYTYEWDFDNDGTIDSTETDNFTNHAYTSADTYTVSLTITDTVDGSDTETKVDYITIYDALVAMASANVTEVLVDSDIEFSSSVTGGKPGHVYSWDFDDGTPMSDLENPTHSYTASGNYAVTLTVTDGLGNIDTDTIDIIVYQLGDANEDGDVTVNDITYIEHIIMEESGYEQTPWADVNNDDQWNVLDITAIEIIIMQNP